MSEELKPCPFCGGHNVTLDFDLKRANTRMEGSDRYLNGHFVECQDCFAGTGYHETSDTAVTAWNGRPDGWKKVEDELPVETGNYLVWQETGRKSGEYHLNVLKFNDGRFVYGSGRVEIGAYGVTHWIPFPDPPALTLPPPLV